MQFDALQSNLAQTRQELAIRQNVCKSLEGKVSNLTEENQFLVGRTNGAEAEVRERNKRLEEQKGALQNEECWSAVKM